MADVPFGFSPRDVDRIRRMLAAFEAGNLGRASQSTPPQQSNTETLWMTVASVIDVGRYEMTLLLPSTDDISDTGEVQASDFGEAYTPSDDSIRYIGINAVEIGQDDPALAAGDICRCTIRQRQSNGTIIVAIERVGFNECTAEEGDA